MNNTVTLAVMAMALLGPNDEEQVDTSDDNEKVSSWAETILSPSSKLPPYIDDLADAIRLGDNGEPELVLDASGCVVIEKWFSNRWLGTQIYRVTSLNSLTGDLVLRDEEYHQAALANFKTGPKKHGWRFKVPVPRLNLNNRERPLDVVRDAFEPKVKLTKAEKERAKKEAESRRKAKREAKELRRKARGLR